MAATTGGVLLGCGSAGNEVCCTVLPPPLLVFLGLLSAAEISTAAACCYEHVGDAALKGQAYWHSFSGSCPT